MSSSLRKILICGLGSIGRRYLRIINQNMPDIKIAVMRSGYGPFCEEVKLIDHQTSNLEESIAWGPDAAIISSPANLHVDQAITLGVSRVPCLIEKPLGSGDESFDKWEKIVHLSEIVPMLMGYIHRHDPCTMLVKKKLEENLLGNVIEADFHCGSWLPKWRPEIDYLKSVSANKALGGGVLLELSHEIDIANMLLGPIKLKYANLKPSGLLPIDVEDRAYLIAENSKGVLISIRINFCSEPSSRKAIIRGEKGAIIWDIALGKLEIRNDKDVIYQYKNMLDRDSLFLIQIKHFMDCVFNNQNPKCSVAEGKYALEIAQRAKEIYKLNSLSL
tara:strand:+ start:198 stop:1193 length:996 start_codon:yes stop_codon:yes gene_type:complete